MHKDLQLVNKDSVSKLQIECSFNDTNHFDSAKGSCGHTTSFNTCRDHVETQKEIPCAEWFIKCQDFTHLSFFSELS